MAWTEYLKGARQMEENVEISEAISPFFVGLVEVTK